MSTQEIKHKVTRKVSTGVPDRREYDSVEDAEVDRALVDAIEAAEKADNSYLTELLQNELGSHYYSEKK